MSEVQTVESTTTITSQKRRKRMKYRKYNQLVKSPLLLLASLILLGFIFISIFPNWIAPHDPHEQILTSRLQPPGYVDENGQTYLLGSDHLGRDVLSRLIHGARASLIVGIASTILAVIVGTAVGLIGGYKGGRINDFLMRVADVQLAFPFFLLAITIASVLGPSLPVVILILALGNWVAYARVVRSEVLVLRVSQFVASARALGLSTFRILFRHILPNCIGSIIVLLTFNIAFAIVMEAGLSFLGLGIPGEYSSWGDMLSSGREFVDTAWWLSTFPGLSIFLVTLAINLFGDFLREVLDPHMKQDIS